MKCEAIDMNGECKLMTCLHFHIGTEKLSSDPLTFALRRPKLVLPDLLA